MRNAMSSPTVGRTRNIVGFQRFRSGGGGAGEDAPVAGAGIGFATSVPSRPGRRRALSPE